MGRGAEGAIFRFWIMKWGFKIIHGFHNRWLLQRSLHTDHRVSPRHSGKLGELKWPHDWLKVPLMTRYCVETDCANADSTHYVRLCENWVLFPRYYCDSHELNFVCPMSPLISMRGTPQPTLHMSNQPNLQLKRCDSFDLDHIDY